MTFIFLCLITGAFIVELIKKYILRVEEPNINDYLKELEEKEWYKALIKDDDIKDFIEISKENGLLSDPHYVRNIIDKEGHREGFIRYLIEKVK